MVYLIRGLVMYDEIFVVAILAGGRFCRKIPKNGGDFYGMELPRVGAFTEKWGS